ncbi:unnamed protein product [Lepeophtheirus salmonis]|uniref:(salmon louse) hypothetical protein n=1 Tax=Lepeophtheirus salmonis TaxID=72036 RepID=A0A817FCJ9_LEPSM|nr:unnamed protein product [Lepeophtheirus salmonis]
MMLVEDLEELEGKKKAELSPQTIIKAVPNVHGHLVGNQHQAFDMSSASRGHQWASWMDKLNKYASLFRERFLKSSGSIEKVRTIETSINPSKEMEMEDSLLLLECKGSKSLHKPFKKKSVYKSNSILKERKCNFCNARHLFIKSECPATRRDYNRCGKTGHFAIYCKSLVCRLHRFHSKNQR